MKRMLMVLMLGCSTAPTARTIEPTFDAPSSAEDHTFVLSREARVHTPSLRADFPIHLEEKWWPFRAEYLGITIAEAQSRDAKISNQQPPQGFWDEQTAIEAVSVWTALCNECHGGRRKLKDSIEMPPPPANWGAGEGLFFGRSRPYAEIFNVVFNGGPERDGVPSEMPNWGKRMAREQIWSLIYFIWYQSGGVKGAFPPSLYPRPPENIDD